MPVPILSMRQTKPLAIGENKRTIDEQHVAVKAEKLMRSTINHFLSVGKDSGSSFLSSLTSYESSSCSSYSLVTIVSLGNGDESWGDFSVYVGEAIVV
jgi:hypothetical protein